MSKLALESNYSLTSLDRVEFLEAEREMDHLALSDDNLAYVGETGTCECSKTAEE